MPAHLYISAGETSGEQHAAKLVRALREAKPDIRFTGMGGDILREARVETIIDTVGRAVMGFVEVLRHLPFSWHALDAAVRHVEQRRPDAVILVDYPGFHLRLARAIRRKTPDIPILYYVAPKVWAWNESRVERIRECVDKVFCIFPFEEAYFAEHGIKAEYVGNPTADAIRHVPDRKVLRAQMNVADHARVVSILPGSRRKELERILPAMLDAAEEIRVRYSTQEGDLGSSSHETTFLLALAPSFSMADLKGIAELPDWVRVVEGESLRIMAVSDLLLAKSGTTTLEGALLGVPMIVAYRSSWITAAIAKRLVRIPHFSLPNIIAGRKIVTELFQEEATGPVLAREAIRLLEDTENYEQMQQDLQDLRQALGDEPAAERTAQAVIRFLTAASTPQVF